MFESFKIVKNSNGKGIFSKKVIFAISQNKRLNLRTFRKLPIRVIVNNLLFAREFPKAKQRSALKT